MNGVIFKNRKTGSIIVMPKTYERKALHTVLNRKNFYALEGEEREKYVLEVETKRKEEAQTILDATAELEKIESTKKVVVDLNFEDMTLEKAQELYFEKFEKKVSNGYLNNLEWIISKIR